MTAAGPVVLIVDDEKGLLRVLSKELARMGFSPVTAETAEAGLEAHRRSRPDAVLLDLKLPDRDGLDVLDEMKRESPAVEVVLMTAHGSIDTAIDAMKRGAMDYVTKPCRLQEMEALLRKAIEKKSLREQNAQLRRELPTSVRPLVETRSPRMREVLAAVPRVAGSDVPVLVLGESGTGKEVIAREIHRRGPRADRPFVVVDCGTLKDSLLESELFGHEKGAFTGATETKEGLLEVAHGGTVFFDEIGDMAMPLQGTLLRFIQFGEYRRVGGTATRKADARVIAATNKELAAAVKEKRFREDLYYRLNVVTLLLPPLRDRPDDVWPLAKHFFERAGAPALADALGPDVRRLFEGYRWPGNIREMENFVQRLVILGQDRPGPFAVEEVEKLLFPLAMQSDTEGALLSLHHVEREHILRVLESAGGNKTRAAKRLGISLKTLYNKLQVYGVGAENRPSNAAPEEP